MRYIVKAWSDDERITKCETDDFFIASAMAQTLERMCVDIDHDIRFVASCHIDRLAEVHEVIIKSRRDKFFIYTVVIEKVP